MVAVDPDQDARVRPAGARSPMTDPMPDDDIVRYLTTQHAEIRDLLGEIDTRHQQTREQAFDQLCAVWAQHQAAAEDVLRPLTERWIRPDQTDLLNDEERQVDDQLQRSEMIEEETEEFSTKFADLKRMILVHLQHEENVELSAVLDRCTADERSVLGRQMRATEPIPPPE